MTDQRRTQILSNFYEIRITQAELLTLLASGDVVACEGFFNLNRKAVAEAIRTEERAEASLDRVIENLPKIAVQRKADPLVVPMNDYIPPYAIARKQA